jgi:hypothetical protein
MRTVAWGASGVALLGGNVDILGQANARGRVGEPEEIAEIVLFLADPATLCSSSRRWTRWPAAGRPSCSLPAAEYASSAPAAPGAWTASPRTTPSPSPPPTADRARPGRGVRALPGCRRRDPQPVDHRSRRTRPEPGPGRRPRPGRPLLSTAAGQSDHSGSGDEEATAPTERQDTPRARTANRAECIGCLATQHERRWGEPACAWSSTVPGGPPPTGGGVVGGGPLSLWHTEGRSGVGERASGGGRAASGHGSGAGRTARRGGAATGSAVASHQRVGEL